jgi:hypothetical protein
MNPEAGRLATTNLIPLEETMKIRLVTLLGLAISFALPIFAQQTNTPDPQLHQQLVALFKKFDEVWNSNDHATWAALFVLVLTR